MSISANSRYAQSTVVAVDKGSQPVNVITLGQSSATTFSYITHMYTHNDRLDNLANQYYSDPSQWWVIANANPELIDWTNIEPGTLIRIPFS